MMELPLVLSVYHFWTGFQPIQKLQNGPPLAKRAVWGQNSHLGLWAVLKWPKCGAMGWLSVEPSRQSVWYCYQCSWSTLGHLWAFLPVRVFSVTIPTLVGGINNTQALSHPIHNVSLGNWWRFDHVWKQLFQKKQEKNRKFTFWPLSKKFCHYGGVRGGYRGPCHTLPYMLRYLFW